MKSFPEKPASNLAGVLPEFSSVSSGFPLKFSLLFMVALSEGYLKAFIHPKGGLGSHLRRTDLFGFPSWQSSNLL